MRRIFNYLYPFLFVLALIGLTELVKVDGLSQFVSGLSDKLHKVVTLHDFGSWYEWAFEWGKRLIDKFGFILLLGLGIILVVPFVIGLVLFLLEGLWFLITLLLIGLFWLLFVIFWFLIIVVVSYILPLGIAVGAVVLLIVNREDADGALQIVLEGAGAVASIVLAVFYYITLFSMM